MDNFKRSADGKDGRDGGNGSVDQESTVTDEWKLGDPDRRKTSSRKRAAYAREHGLSTSSADSGNSNGKPWKHYIPKSVVWMMLTFVTAVGGWFAKQFVDIQLQWKETVNDHVKGSTAGYQRLDANEKEIKAVRRDVSKLAGQFRDYRIDQIEEKVWNARRHSDFDAVRYFEGQLRRLKAEED